MPFIDSVISRAWIDFLHSFSDFVDINIGYQFVNILYRDGDGSLGVDTDLINDVREQNGGGGEPLIFENWWCYQRLSNNLQKPSCTELNHDVKFTWVR